MLNTVEKNTVLYFNQFRYLKTVLHEFEMQDKNMRYTKIDITFLHTPIHYFLTTQETFTLTKSK